ncbi:metalloregulator ArsR/SmtB family transcription factor [Granulosicoccus sp.]|nr:metalloregulator ArsR/SmtB family transcription factor [Granulosicoccus sp.]MDB4223635.1 metalloregulator ArsR/SmtB family transcription factor [Granulosicoccus sp.]
MKHINDKKATEYSRWFKCLGDATRVKLLSIVASADAPLTVGEIVERMGKSQSTVSHHLRILANERFVFTEGDSTKTYVRINKKCMTELPDAAAEIMGQAVGKTAE